MIILGATGVAFFEPRLFVGAVLPFLIGFGARQYRQRSARVLRPLRASADSVFGFALGNGIDLNVIAKSGMAGVLLGLAVIVVTGIPLILADRCDRGRQRRGGTRGFVDGGRGGG